jgi:hypothetical protein
MRDARFSVLAANEKCRVIAELLKGGRLLVLDGERPDSPDEAVSTQVCLVAFDLGNPVFDDPDDGRMVAAPIGSAPALATGTPTWFRCEDMHHDAVLDGSVGPTDDPGGWYDMLCDGIEAGGEVEIESFVYVERRR